MKALSILFLTIFLFLQTNAQIKIYDGRSKPANTKISDQEKKLIENFVQAKEKAIKEIGEKRDFKCAEDSFHILGSANGSFTKKFSNQKAFLYSICLDDGGKYALPLGGIIMVDGNKIVAHFVYTHRWFDWIKSLPDINSNGFSELIAGFTELRGSLSFERMVGIYEATSNELDNMAILTSESNLPENDGWLTYKGYVKKGQTPVFYVEEFKLSEKDKWIKTKDLKKTESNKESERIFTKLKTIER